MFLGGLEALDSAGGGLSGMGNQSNPGARGRARASGAGSTDGSTDGPAEESKPFRARRSPEERAARAAARAERTALWHARMAALRERREQAQAERDAADVANPLRVVARVQAGGLRRVPGSGPLPPSPRNEPVTDALLARLERQYRRLIDQAEADAARNAKLAEHDSRPSVRESTWQTAERARKVRQSPLLRMHKLGKISNDELRAAIEIGQVVEMIELAVSIRSASLEARVDCSSSSRDALVEGLKMVRLEVAYRAWREAIPTPRRMIIDMVASSNESYVELARRHKLHWRTARKRLISALRLWPTFKKLAEDSVDRSDLAAVYARLGVL